jgi:hypothetical protein
MNKIQYSFGVFSFTKHFNLLMNFHVQCQDKAFVMISSTLISFLFLAFYCGMDMSICMNFMSKDQIII